MDIISFTPLYNFINNTHVAETPVLRHLLRLLILYGFLYFPPKWHKLPADGAVRLAQTEIPVRFLTDIY